MSDSNSAAIFVLVSGAWHAGWCWERVQPLLEARGHIVLAPDLLGMGADQTPLDQISLASWADQIAGIVEDQPRPVILVGHSRGGIVISEVAERVPGRIRRLVYLSAVLLPAGRSILTAFPQRSEMEQSSQGMMIPGPDGTTTMRPEAIQPNLYNTTQAKWMDRAASLLGPEPMASFSTPLQLTDARYGSVQRAYIELLKDVVLPIAQQREMQEALPCTPVIMLDTDHSPFYSDPEGLTAALEQMVRV